MGRPDTYYPEFDEVIYRMRLLSLSDEELCEYFGIVDETFKKWKRLHPTFLAAYIKGGEDADATVANALRKRARGAKIKKQVAMRIKDGPNSERIEIVEVEEELPPDTAAASLWLANRQRARWKLKPEDAPPPKSENEDLPAIRIVGGLPE